MKWAATWNTPTLLTFLLDYGAAVEAAYFERSSVTPRVNPLMIAANWNRLENCAVLLQRGADVHVCDSQGRSALYLAAAHEGGAEVCKLLLAHAASVGVKTQAGITPLMRAGRESLDVLLAHGSDIRAHDLTGRTALLIRAEEHEARRYEMLVAAGANATTRDNEGRTALDLVDGDFTEEEQNGPRTQTWDYLKALATGRVLDAELPEASPKPNARF